MFLQWQLTFASPRSHLTGNWDPRSGRYAHVARAMAPLESLEIAAICPTIRPCRCELSLTAWVGDVATGVESTTAKDCQAVSNVIRPCRWREFSPTAWVSDMIAGAEQMSKVPPLLVTPHSNCQLYFMEQAFW